MTALCALKFGVIGLVFGGWSVVLWIVAYAIGRRTATRRYWDMLNVAGSRFGGK